MSSRSISSIPRRTAPGPRERRAALESQLLRAAEKCLEERPLRELTIEAVMARTRLARTNFYRLFADVPHLLLRLAEQVERGINEVAKAWHDGTGDIQPDVTESLRGVVSVYAQHGSILRALADAGALDAELGEHYHALIGRFAEATQHRIERENAAGRARVADPALTARALVLMTDALLRFETEPARAALDQPRVTATLAPLWLAGIAGATH